MTTPGNMNIDFLLGLGSSPEGISPSGPAGAEDGGPLFGELLNEMLMSYPGAVNRPVVDADGQNPTPFAPPKGAEIARTVGNGEVVVSIDKDALPLLAPEQLLEMQPVISKAAQPNQMTLEGVPDSSDKAILSNVPMADSAPTVVAENIAAFNREIRAQLPTDALPMQNRAIKMNLAVPTNLEPGNYEIIESKLSDGAVTLKLADPSTRSGFIQVELPAESLVSDAAQPIAVKRVDLDAAPRQTTNIERLFAQLNLKQIEVSNVAVNDDSTNDHLALKFTGLKANVDVELKAQLPQDQLRALKVEPQISSETKAMAAAKTANKASLQNPDVVQTALTDGKAFDKQVAAEPRQTIKQEATEASRPIRSDAVTAPLFAPAPVPKMRNASRQMRSDRALAGDAPQAEMSVENDRLLTTFDQSLKQGQTVANKLVDNVVRQTKSEFGFSTFGNETDQADAFASLDTVRGAGKSETGKLSQREVRFSLPDDLASRLKPNGQSVMIRIQPDHLGPARLSLRMHQNKLSARITVETVGIKSVVEQSLDRLTQQLIKSGIDVERIEVALDGRQSGDQLSERHPHWQRQARPTHFDENILTETNEVSPVIPVAAVAPAYVGAGGVNVLA